MEKKVRKRGDKNVEIKRKQKRNNVTKVAWKREPAEVGVMFEKKNEINLLRVGK